jgi:hypothetical protein
VRRSAALVLFMTLGGYIVLKRPRRKLGYVAMTEKREREERMESLFLKSKAAVHVTNYKIRL